jgi:hypothetical protein
MPEPIENQITTFAETNFRGQRKKFGIRQDDRRRHMYIVGKTGMGKTNLMENMVISDIHAGNGVCVVDPHGEFADKMLDYIPTQRINDVIYFNPADLDYPIAFNVMEAVDPRYKHLVASGLVGVFKKIWADTWGPRLEYVLRNAILALLDYQGSTLLGIMRMLVDKEFRSKVIKKITDPVVKSFWVEEFSKYPDRFMAEAIAPIQNKVGQFLSISLIRNIVGQPKSTIDMRDIIDNRKILLLNLAKGRVGEDASALFGAMMITKLQLAAMSRVDISEEKRTDFYLYVDEFQNFATDSFADILSEARKYRLNLIIAHQYIGQLISGSSTRIRDAVFGNVGTIITFRVGAADAEFLAREYEPVFNETHLVNLTKFTVYLKLMINGVASQAFSAATLPPTWMVEGNRGKIIKVSRERYAKRREVVEEKIARWSGVAEEGEEEEMEEPYVAQRNKEKPKFIPKPKFEGKKPYLPKIPVPSSFKKPAPSRPAGPRAKELVKFHKPFKKVFEKFLPQKEERKSQKPQEKREAPQAQKEAPTPSAKPQNFPQRNADKKRNNEKKLKPGEVVKFE